VLTSDQQTRATDLLKRFEHHRTGTDLTSPF
jgi:hypothetical protein